MCHSWNDSSLPSGLDWHSENKVHLFSSKGDVYHNTSLAILVHVGTWQFPQNSVSSFPWLCNIHDISVSKCLLCLQCIQWIWWLLIPQTRQSLTITSKCPWSYSAPQLNITSIHKCCHRFTWLLELAVVSDPLHHLVCDWQVSLTKHLY